MPIPDGQAVFERLFIRHGMVIERLVSKFQQFYTTSGSVQMAVIPASGWRRQLWLADPLRAGCVMNQNGDDYRGCDKAWQKEDNTIH
jgi:hypothetical protein